LEVAKYVQQFLKPSVFIVMYRTVCDL